MRKSLTVAALAIAGLLIASPSMASNEGVCEGEKFDVEELPATTSDGVVITLVDDNTVHFDLPEGAIEATVCVKAGSINQGDGPEVSVITADANVDHSTGKDLSHVSVIDVVFGESPTPTPSESPSPTPSESPSPTPSESPSVPPSDSDTPSSEVPNTPRRSPLPKTGIDPLWFYGIGGLLLTGTAALRYGSRNK